MDRGVYFCLMTAPRCIARVWRYGCLCASLFAVVVNTIAQYAGMRARPLCLFFQFQVSSPVSCRAVREPNYPFPACTIFVPALAFQCVGLL